MPLTVIVACCLLLAGCTGGIGVFEDDADDTAVDVDAIEANADTVESYHVEVERTLRSGMVNETTTIDGPVDVTDRQAHLTMTTETHVGADPRTTETEQYVLADERYTTDGDEFDRTDDGNWEETHRLASATDSLENASFEPIRTETVDGVETTMYELNVSDEHESELAGIDDSGHVGTTLEEFVAYVLVDTETDTLYGTDVRMQVSQGGEPAVVTVETTFTDYDGVEVSVPDELSSDDE
ncbi:hypothetical protein [Natronobacterium gregoryi]|nr:hypothetical protein [Natronobacterium gregoryi]AFZ74256.1 hypothetical protein Natgr_3125 [Natronobacterium gregoryi SP2]PLK22088.1 hypothetical protein CYV19_00745 [Natronobacterium gregoryi SP2]SFI52467.1 hypothetical protein SAMN05443661_101144 [Natronobacterium gregoryi]